MDKNIIKTFGYTGSKRTFVKDIFKCLEGVEYNRLIDPFGGSGVVGINSDAKEVFYNEMEPHVNRLFKGLVESNPHQFKIDMEQTFTKYKINELIETYNLNSYKDQLWGAPEDVKQIVNRTITKDNLTTPKTYSDLLYLVKIKFSAVTIPEIMYKKNFSIRRKLYPIETLLNDYNLLYEQIKDKNITITQKDAFEFLNEFEYKSGDVLYLDPPYLDTYVEYGDKGADNSKWSQDLERKLYEIIKKLSDKGVIIIYSNYSSNPLITELMSAENFKIVYAKNSSGMQTFGKTRVEVIISNLDLPVVVEIPQAKATLFKDKETGEIKEMPNYDSNNSNNIIHINNLGSNIEQNKEKGRTIPPSVERALNAPEVETVDSIYAGGIEIKKSDIIKCFERYDELSNKIAELNKEKDHLQELIISQKSE